MSWYITEYMSMSDDFLVLSERVKYSFGHGRIATYIDEPLVRIRATSQSMVLDTGMTFQVSTLELGGRCEN